MTGTLREGLARVAGKAIYEAQRGTVPADDPLLAVVGIPWDQAPSAVRDAWTRDVGYAMADATLAYFAQQQPDTASAGLTAAREALERVAFMWDEQIAKGRPFLADPALVPALRAALNVQVKP